jgi:hypothetical protein
MDSPSPPAVPDPVATADAQGRANTDAARLTTRLNRYDQFTPLGNQTWSNNSTFDQTGYDAAMREWERSMQQFNQGSNPAPQGPSGSGWSPGTGEGSQSFTGGGSPGMGGGGMQPSMPSRDDFMSGGDNWASTVTLDPRVQALLDSELATSQGLNNTIGSALSRVQSVLGQDLDYASLPGAGNIDERMGEQRGQYADLTDQIAGQQGLVTGAQGLQATQAQRLAQMLGQPMPGVDGATRDKVSDALYSDLTSRLDPRFSSEEASLRSTLMNRGLTEGSEAWNTEMDRFGRTKNDAYGQAGYESIVKGGDEMRKLFDMAMGVRDQGLQEADTVSGLGSRAVGDLNSLAGRDESIENSIIGGANTLFNADNTSRQNALTEQERRRQLVLNELASLRGGAQAPMPQFAGQNANANVQPSPIAQSIWNAYQGQMGQYQSDVSSNNAFMAALAQLGGSAMLMR